MLVTGRPMGVVYLGLAGLMELVRLDHRFLVRWQERLIFWVSLKDFQGFFKCFHLILNHGHEDSRLFLPVFNELHPRGKGLGDFEPGINVQELVWVSGFPRDCLPNLPDGERI
jgi:hypothetical protein